MPPSDSPTFTTLFDDNFANDTSLNTSIWSIQFGPASDFVFGNGALTLTSYRSQGFPQIGFQQFDGGASDGEGYGQFSVTASLNANEGTGVALLMWPADNVWPGPEIDLLETFDERGTAYTTIHYEGPGDTNDYTPYSANVDLTQKNTFTMQWLPGSLTFFINGTEIFSTTQNVPKDFADGGVNETFGAEVVNGGTDNSTESSVSVHLYDMNVQELVQCFTPGAMIATPEGERAVETLREGETVMIWRDQRFVPCRIAWIGRRQIDLTEPRWHLAQPVRVRANAFGPRRPDRDLLLSPDHAVSTRAGLVPIHLLVNHHSIVEETGWESVTYIHIGLDRHALLVANGVTVESYLHSGSVSFFDDMYPELVAPTVSVGEFYRQHGCAPLVEDPGVLQALWEDTAWLAPRIGITADDAAAEPSFTEDPMLVVEVGGAGEVAGYVSTDRAIVTLPPHDGTVRIRSRHFRANTHTPWINDRRRLGVAVRDILVRNGRRFHRVPLDSDALAGGWHRTEGSGSESWRWTNGEALLRLEASSRPSTLMLSLHGTGRYPVASRR